MDKPVAITYTWTTPKTNWVRSDYVTPSDYNRIKENLLYLNNMLNERYPSYEQELDLGYNKIIGSRNRPSDWNAFEDALESFTRIGKDVNIGERSNFTDNAPFINADQLNRIELCCQNWYDLPFASNIITLPFTFANGVVAVSSDGTKLWVQQNNYKKINEQSVYPIHYADVSIDPLYFDSTAYDPLPKNLYGGTMLYLGEQDSWHKLLAVGGYMNKSASSFLTNSDKQWERKSDPISDMVDNTYPCVGFVKDGEAYTYSMNEQERNKLKVFNSEQNLWNTIAQKNPLNIASIMISSSYSLVSIVSTEFGDFANLKSYLYRNTASNWNWKKYLQLPNGYMYGTLVLHNGTLYYVGGVIGDERTGSYSTGERSSSYYKLVDEEWVRVGDIPYDTIGACAVSYNNKIFVIGGRDHAKQAYFLDG